MSNINQPAGSRALIMGNEAIARGAIEAGVQLMAAYPGTPSSCQKPWSCPCSCAR